MRFQPTLIAKYFKDKLDQILTTSAGSDGSFERPALKHDKESNIEGLYVIGDLAGAPVIKLAMEDGVNVVDTILKSGNSKLNKLDQGIFDLIVVGAGAAGLNAALAAQENNLSVLILEKNKVANTIEDFPEGKWVYAEPDQTPAKGKLWLDGAKKEDLLKRWNDIIKDNKLNVKTDEALISLKKVDGIFELTTSKDSYKAGKVVLATGQRGNPKKLNIPGEEQEHVYHRLYSPMQYQGEDILVVGGGNSAIEAALTLADKNRVTLSYRSGEFSRLFKDNRKLIEEALNQNKIDVIFNSEVLEFKNSEYTLKTNESKTENRKFDHAFVLIGSELPITFLKSLGLKLENEWNGSFWASFAMTLCCLLGLSIFKGNLADFKSQLGAVVAIASFLGLFFTGKNGNRYSWLGISFLVWHTVYGVKVGKDHEFWPFTGWGYSLLSFFNRPWSFWYTVIYTLLMTCFGLSALKRWGIDKKDKFQIWRYVSLISFQWIFFFLIPEFLFQYAVKYQFVGEALSNNPQFAEQGWRTYGIVYAWPLFFYTFFYNPHQIWVVWGVLLTFLFIPILVLFHGKRYCSWICGCGGLAETFGDRWRHLAPKGKTSIAWEKMGTVVLFVATIVTLGMLFKDTYSFLNAPTERGMWVYRIIVDVWLVGILPVTFYPFLGGKVWCRYWCPLAKLMQFQSKWFGKLGISKFAIEANDKCIGCKECSRYCQVGIDVMSYALKQETLDNQTSSCIGCGVCVTVCPMDTLSFGNKESLKVLN